MTKGNEIEDYKLNIMAKYFMQEMPDMRNEGETLLYPRIEITGICETEELVESCIKGSTFRRAEIKGALDLVANEMGRIMADGRSVRIDGIGLFTPSLSLKKGKEREKAENGSTKRNATSIKVGDIKFRPDKNLINETDRHCELERGSKVKRCMKSKFTAEERLGLAINYLDNNAFLTVAGYAALSGLNRTKASMELKAWATNPESGITYTGKGTHKVYVKKN